MRDNTADQEAVVSTGTHIVEKLLYVCVWQCGDCGQLYGELNPAILAENSYRRSIVARQTTRLATVWRVYQGKFDWYPYHPCKSQKGGAFKP